MDDPANFVSRLAMQAAFAGQPLGTDILGSAESITAMLPQSLKNYADRHYHAGNIVVSAAGNIEPELILAGGAHAGPFT